MRFLLPLFLALFSSSALAQSYVIMPGFDANANTSPSSGVITDLDLRFHFTKRNASEPDISCTIYSDATTSENITFKARYAVVTNADWTKDKMVLTYASGDVDDKIFVGHVSQYKNSVDPAPVTYAFNMCDALGNSEALLSRAKTTSIPTGTYTGYSATSEGGTVVLRKSGSQTYVGTSTFSFDTPAGRRLDGLRCGDLTTAPCDHVNEKTHTLSSTEGNFCGVVGSQIQCEPNLGASDLKLFQAWCGGGSAPVCDSLGNPGSLCSNWSDGANCFEIGELTTGTCSCE